MTRQVENLPGMVGRHPSMLMLYERARRAARASIPVLIVGETGTGKELVARALHQLAPRKNGPFVPVNCAAVPDGVAEAELFGVEPGAFTGATHRRRGLLARADGGTLFLDEIASASGALQAKLLRAVEHGEFMRVGGVHAERAAFRLVAAASVPPDDLLHSGTLRPDLFHRLAMSRLHVPALRERVEDIVPLAEHFLAGLCGPTSRPKALDASAHAVLRRYRWPGNVRELQGVMHALSVFVDADCLTANHVEPELASESEEQFLDERTRVVTSLEANGWNAAATARVLGVSRTKLYGLLRLHGIQRPSGDPDEPGSVRTECSRSVRARTLALGSDDC